MGATVLRWICYFREVREAYGGIGASPSPHSHDQKDNAGTESYNPNGLIPRAVRAIKQAVPDILVITDAASTPTAARDMTVCRMAKFSNDVAMVKQALVQAEVDFVAPSDMMDGRLGHCNALMPRVEQCGILLIPPSTPLPTTVHSDDLDSAPALVTRKPIKWTQLTPEAIKEMDLDIAEGADIVMVKQHWRISTSSVKFKSHTNLPVAAYNVSGEHAMIKAAAEGLTRRR